MLPQIRVVYWQPQNIKSWSLLTPDKVCLKPPSNTTTFLPNSFSTLSSLLTLITYSSYASSHIISFVSIKSLEWRLIWLILQVDLTLITNGIQKVEWTIVWSLGLIKRQLFEVPSSSLPIFLFLCSYFCIANFHIFSKFSHIHISCFTNPFSVIYMSNWYSKCHLSSRSRIVAIGVDLAEIRNKVNITFLAEFVTNPHHWGRQLQSFKDLPFEINIFSTSRRQM